MQALHTGTVANLSKSVFPRPDPEPDATFKSPAPVVLRNHQTECGSFSLTVVIQGQRSIANSNPAHLFESSRFRLVLTSGESLTRESHDVLLLS